MNTNSLQRDKTLRGISSRVKARELPITVLWMLVFCSFPPTSRAQVPVYEVTPVESTVKFGVDSSGAYQRHLREVERKDEVFLHGCEERRFGNRDSSG